MTSDGQSFYLGTNLPVGDTIDGGILYVGSVGAIVPVFGLFGAAAWVRLSQSQALRNFK